MDTIPEASFMPSILLLKFVLVLVLAYVLLSFGVLKHSTVILYYHSIYPCYPCRRLHVLTAFLPVMVVVRRTVSGSYAQ